LPSSKTHARQNLYLKKSSKPLIALQDNLHEQPLIEAPGPASCRRVGPGRDQLVEEHRAFFHRQRVRLAIGAEHGEPFAEDHSRGNESCAFDSALASSLLTVRLVELPRMRVAN